MESGQGGKQDALDWTHTHTHKQKGRKEQPLTSDSPGRPRPESDTFCRLKQRGKDVNEERGKRGGSDRNMNLKAAMMG